jgi:acetyl esterase/lipase
MPELLGVEDILGLPAPSPGERAPYGADPLQYGELRLPSGEGPHALAVVIHGGCWRSRYDAGHIGAFSAALARSGIATWTIEYRRVGDEGGGWPGTFLDVARAADHVRELARSRPIDGSRVVAVGHSAGGHLALWLASRRKLGAESAIRGASDPLPLAGVVSLAGVDDLRRALRERVCDDMASQLVGGVPEKLGPRYAEASPIELLPLGVPLHLLNGALDPIVPVSFGRDFERASRAAGDEVKLTVLDDAGHFELIAPGSRSFAPVRDAVLELVRR